MTKEQDYFKSFCAVSAAFGTTLGESEILDLIVGSSIETMGGMAACLFLADEEEDISDLEKLLNPPKPVQSLKIGRNDPCPCGSGKKYKKYCG